MIAIPQEEYSQLTTVQNIRQPLTQQLHNLERDYKANEGISDPYKRMMLQSETLEEMKDLKNQMRNYITFSTPKPYRHRAQALFHSIESHINFNDRGEIMDRHGNVIQHSRLEDLVQHAVRDRRRSMVPIGWDEFVNVLRDRNIPRSTLNRETLDELERATFNTTSIGTKLPGRISRPRKRVVRVKSTPSPPPVRKHESTFSRSGRPQKKSKRYPSSDFLKYF